METQHSAIPSEKFGACIGMDWGDKEHVYPTYWLWKLPAILCGLSSPVIF